MGGLAEAMRYDDDTTDLIGAIRCLIPMTWLFLCLLFGWIPL
jgi:hypothetical protein